MTSSRSEWAANPVLRQKTWPWWHATFGDKLGPEGRTLLEKCGVPADEVDRHVYKVRDEAWEIFPFPCIGEFWFLEFGVTHHPQFAEIVKLLQSGPSNVIPEPLQQEPASSADNSHSNPVVASILANPASRRLVDLGTCLGQDLRALLQAGAPASTLYGSDLFAAFEAAGHSMFLDASTFRGRFFVADVFSDEAASPLNATAGCWDVITANMFLHQFDKAKQRAIMARMVRMLRDEPGAMLVGNNTGQTEPEEMEMRKPFVVEGEKKMIYRQSRESMTEMWEGVLEEFEGLRGEGHDWRKRWSVWCDYDQKEIEKRARERKTQGEVRFFQGGQQRRVMFCIKRV